MNQPNTLSDILKNVHSDNSSIIFDGFRFKNDQISYLELKNNLEIVNCIFNFKNTFNKNKTKMLF